MKIVHVAILALAALALVGCKEETARDKNMKAQAGLIEKATTKYPVPNVNNFPAREAVAKQVRRMDELGKLYYVYLFADNGQQMGYYVANTRPIATCSLLTPPQEVRTSQINNLALNAPSMGGTYSPNPTCSSVFFFDAQTDAYIEISGLNYFVSDMPLAIKAEPIRVANQ